MPFKNDVFENIKKNYRIIVIAIRYVLAPMHTLESFDPSQPLELSPRLATDARSGEMKSGNGVEGAVLHGVAAAHLLATLASTGQRPALEQPLHCAGGGPIRPVLRSSLGIHELRASISAGLNAASSPDEQYPLVRLLALSERWLETGSLHVDVSGRGWRCCAAAERCTRTSSRLVQM